MHTSVLVRSTHLFIYYFLHSNIQNNKIDEKNVFCYFSFGSTQTNKKKKKFEFPSKQVSFNLHKIVGDFFLLLSFAEF